MKKYNLGFGILIILVIGFFIFGEIFLPRETEGMNSECELLQTTWYRIMDDQSEVPVTVPSEIDLSKNEDLVLTCTLPQIPDAGYQLFFRSSQQDMYIYIDGELRASYDTTDVRIWGSSSMSCNVFADVTEKDSGKQLTLVTRSCTGYNGVINAVYLGTPMGIYHFLMDKYAIGLVVALLLLFTCLVLLIICTFLQGKYHTIFPMTYAACTGIIVSIEAMAESKLRQYFVGNMEVAGSVSYLMIGLIPIAITLYINSTQRRRYEKVMRIFLLVCFLNVIVNLLLQAFGVQDLLASMTRSYVLFAASFIIYVITTVMDAKKGNLKDSKVLCTGIFLAFLLGFGEVLTNVLHFLTVTGFFLSLGMFVLLTTAVLDSINTMIEINTERVEAVAASRSKSGFLANMSHEIRTPINAILGMNEMISRETTETNIRQYSHDVDEAGHSLLEIVNDILDFSKIESGKMQIVETEYSLSELVRELIKLIQDRVKSKNLQLDIQIDEKLPEHLHGDNVRIKQVVLNLLTNAVKYTNQGRIMLYMSSASSPRYEGKPEDMTNMQNLHIEVRDTGIGIRPEEMPKLFENFERLDLKRNRNVEGTGLGLSITANLVRLMHGRIDVRSKYGKGSVFIVDLPQKLTEDTSGIGVFQETAQPEKTVLKTYQETFHAPRAHVLVVDDNKMNIKIFRGLLKKTEVQIDEALSGQECLDLCREKEYDIIFMDHMMPGMDGIETFEQLKEQGLLKCPIIALTANAMEGMKEMFLNKGFDGYLSKPVNPADLEQTLRKMLPPEKMD